MEYTTDEVCAILRFLQRTQGGVLLQARGSKCMTLWGRAVVRFEQTRRNGLRKIWRCTLDTLSLVPRLQDLPK